MANSILNWEKPYHAPMVGSAITLVYMLFWLIDASVLSKLCIIAIIAVLLDFSLPIVNGMISAKWIQENEAKFEHICRTLSEVVDRLSNAYRVFAQMKRTSTKTYYGILMCSLLFVAWLGSLIHNLLLAYLFTLAVALYPGISKQEAFKRRILGFASKISSFVGPSAA
ncbi:PREDICTED: ARL-6-interacting protein 1 homolog, partial [Rhagoletis zephyria]|uniref:ARL-6-interacting protein 1 homolog n=1 Tax=Rhagoletis zephyria TaxID=28612 RepID=UPI0008116D82